MVNCFFKRCLRVPVILVCLLVFAAFLRLYHLGDMPPGITNDEAGYAYSALSLISTGRSLDGKFLPITFNLDNSFSPVQEYIGALFIGLFGMTPFTVRLPFALLSVVSVYLLYRCVLMLYDDKRIAFASAAVLAVSPWHIHLNRVAYDGPISFSCILLLFLLLKSVKHRMNILWALPVFFAAFYSYHATKVFICLFVAFFLWQYRFVFQFRKREVMLFLAGIVVICASFLFVIRSEGITRQQVLFWNNTVQAEKFIRWQRSVSIAPSFVKPLFNNKLTYFWQTLFEQYAAAFSTEYLFLNGEVGGLSRLYGVNFRGAMYRIELPLMIAGMWYLMMKKRNRKESKFILFSLLAAPIGSAMAIDRSYALRSIVMLPFLAIVAGGGVVYVLEAIKKVQNVLIRNGLVISFVSLYTISVISYLYQYHFQYVRYGAESWFQSSKDVARIVFTSKDQFDVVIIAEAGDMFVFQYGFYNALPLTPIRNAWLDPWPKCIGNVCLYQSCSDLPVNPKTIMKQKQKTLLITREYCFPDAKPDRTIVDVAEPLQAIWKIYKN